MSCAAKGRKSYENSKCDGTPWDELPLSAQRAWELVEDIATARNKTRGTRETTDTWSKRDREAGG